MCITALLDYFVEISLFIDLIILIMDHDYVLPLVDEQHGLIELDTSIKLKKKKDSKGTWCCVPGCESRQYQFVDENGVKRRELTVISFFQFPKENCEIKRWCNLIHRQPGRDGFKLSGSTRVCIKHFLPESTNKAPGSTRSRRLPGSEPVLFSWNEFTLSTRKRKEPVERVFLPPTTPQQPPPVPEVLLDESSHLRVRHRLLMSLE